MMSSGIWCIEEAEDYLKSYWTAAGSQAEFQFAAVTDCDYCITSDAPTPVPDQTLSVALSKLVNFSIKYKKKYRTYSQDTTTYPCQSLETRPVDFIDTESLQ